MAYSAIHCKDLDLGVGEEAEYSILNMEQNSEPHPPL